jgi:hypothetical protein
MKKSLVLLITIILAAQMFGQGAAAQTEPAGAVSLELVGQFGGYSYAIETQGDYVYLGVGPRLHILDVSDPERPVLIGRSEPLLPYFITDIVLTGDYALVVGYSGGLRVVDVSDRANPIELGAYDLPAGGENSSVAVTGRHAYVTISGGLRVLDLANPAAPVEVASLSAPEESKWYGVQIAGSQAYLSGSDAFLVLDISNPARPVEVGRLEGRTQLIAVAGGLAYLGRDSRLAVVDVSDPRALAEIGSLDVSDPQPMDESGSIFRVSSVRRGTRAGNLLYLLDGRGEKLKVVDVTDPTRPVEMGTMATQAIDVSNLAAAGRYLYLTSYLAGRMVVVDASGPANLVEVGLYNSDPAGSGMYSNYLNPIPAIANHHAYLMGLYPPEPFRLTNLLAEDAVKQWSWGFTILDLSDPANPAEVDAYRSSLPFPEDIEVLDVLHLVVTGRYAYLVGGGLWIIDISNPTVPVEVGVLENDAFLGIVAVSGVYAYLASADGLLIVDVSDPRHPVEAGVISGSHEFFNVAVAGSFAYLKESDRLRIVDVSDPARPIEVGSYIAGQEGINFLAVEGGFAYLTNVDGLLIVDVSDPTRPVAVSRYQSRAGSFATVAVAGGFAYLVNILEDFETLGSELTILDVTDPATPAEVVIRTSSSLDPWFIWPIVEDDYIYGSDFYGGIQVWRVSRLLDNKSGPGPDEPEAGLAPQAPAPESLPAAAATPAPAAESQDQPAPAVNEVPAPGPAGPVLVTVGLVAGAVLALAAVGIVLRHRRSGQTVTATTPPVPPAAWQYCPHCGAQYPPVGKFCIRCGRPRKESEPG